MLTNYSAVIEAIVQAGTAADSIKANAAAVVDSLKDHREALQNIRNNISEAARVRCASIMDDVTSANIDIEVLQKSIDAMIAQIEGAQPSPEVV